MREKCFARILFGAIKGGTVTFGEKCRDHRLNGERMEQIVLEKNGGTIPFGFASSIQKII